ncbi:MAG: hypothetical protein IJJ01_07560 [Firmicutes bacterium]|nr:hypothetical protein [Bacillota bacterium]
MKVEAFKDLLKHYYDYQMSILQIKEELDVLLYEMTGVKGISYDKIPSSFNPEISEDRKLDFIERLNEKEAELDFTYAAIKLIEMKLSKMTEEEKTLCVEILNRKITYEEAGRNNKYSTSRMWKIVKENLKKVL